MRPVTYIAKTLRGYCITTSIEDIISKFFVGLTFAVNKRELKPLKESRTILPEMKNQILK